MNIKKPSWWLPDRLVTSEQDFKLRRQLLQGLGLGLAWPSLSPLELLAQSAALPKTTPESLASSYNNYYEFSTDKGAVSELCEGVNLGPWDLRIEGLVERPFTLDTSKLTSQFGVEDRTYRFRCVEAWSAVIPWQGFPLHRLISLAKPLSKAKYIEFIAEADPEKMPGLKATGYPWPYTEGLRLDEAAHDLTLLVTGMYGKPLPTQSGSPLRLVVPWKYGFKSIKAIRSIRFTETQPKTLWNQLGPREYGFYANVNPEVDHPRWSQGTEKPLGGWFGRQPTLKFNGYESEVSSLYKGMDLARFY